MRSVPIDGPKGVRIPIFGQCPYLFIYYRIRSYLFASYVRMWIRFRPDRIFSCQVRKSKQSCDAEKSDFNVRAEIRANAEANNCCCGL